MPVRCEDVAPALGDAAGGAVPFDAATRLHIEHCLRCQAEIVQYRRVLRGLRAMRAQVLEPAPGLLPGILATIEEAGERRAIRELTFGHGRRAAYVGGLAAAATAAGVGGALVLAGRTRRNHRLAG
jgi:hypothetical protein